MKVSVLKDAIYPVYVAVPEEEDSRVIEITDAEWSDYQRVMSEYDAWQNLLRDSAYPSG